MNNKTSNIPAGYKQTDVGVIPEDWEVKSIGSVSSFANGKPYEPFINLNGRFCLITLDSISIDGKLKDHHKKVDFHDDSLKTDDLVVVLSDIAHAKLLGLSDLIPASGRFVLNQRMGRVRFTDDVFPQYGRLQLNFRQDFFRARGQGTSQKHIYKRDVFTLQIPLPNKKEQKAIAQALSDIDSLITKLSKLIQKKRHIKQGAMQELLTGKRRLPGFSGEWDEIHLGEILETITDYTANGSFESLKTNVRYYETKNYAVLVRTTDLDSMPFVPARFTDKKGYKFLKKTALHGGELILANVGSLGKVFRVPYFDMPMTLAPNTYLLKVSKKNNETYIYQWMRTNRFYQKLMEIIGSTTLQSINKDNLRSINLSMPIDKHEQAAIAQVLSDMDAEIEALEKQKAKYIDLKQGMMQQLLTGKIRLV